MTFLIISLWSLAYLSIITPCLWGNTTSFMVMQSEVWFIKNHCEKIWQLDYLCWICKCWTFNSLKIVTNFVVVNTDLYQTLSYCVERVNRTIYLKKVIISFPNSFCNCISNKQSRRKQMVPDKENDRLNMRDATDSDS